jgi:hypothetical protein
MRHPLISGRIAPRGAPRCKHSTDEEATMSVWIILLIAALIAALVGFGSAAKWLFILAVIFLAAGLIGIFTRGRGTRV